VKNSNNKLLLGKNAESMAIAYLQTLGYSIIGRNFTIKGGEIDIIAFDRNEGGTLVFVEVKYRKSNFYGEPYESVDYHKQERLRRAAFEYISRHGENIAEDTNFRFDVISISKNGKIKYFKNAFV